MTGCSRIAALMLTAAKLPVVNGGSLTGTPAGERLLMGATRLNGKSQALSLVYRPSSRDPLLTFGSLDSAPQSGLWARQPETSTRRPSAG